MNNHWLGAGAAASAILLATAHVQAQPVTPTNDMSISQLGNFMVRVRAIGIIPENSSSSVSVIGGSVGVTATPAPEVDLSYFLTNNIAVEAIAASTRHEVAAQHSILGHVYVGSVWVLPPTVTLQYHFFPESRFSPYIGAGLTVAFFYDSKPAGPTVTKVGFSNNVGPAIQAGPTTISAVRGAPTSMSSRYSSIPKRASTAAPSSQRQRWIQQSSAPASATGFSRIS